MPVRYIAYSTCGNLAKTTGMRGMDVQFSIGFEQKQRGWGGGTICCFSGDEFPLPSHWKLKLAEQFNSHVCLRLLCKNFLQASLETVPWTRQQKKWLCRQPKLKSRRGHIVEMRSNIYVRIWSRYRFCRRNGSSSFRPTRSLTRSTIASHHSSIYSSPK